MSASILLNAKLILQGKSLFRSGDFNDILVEDKHVNHILFKGRFFNKHEGNIISPWRSWLFEFVDQGISDLRLLPGQPLDEVFHMTPLIPTVIEPLGRSNQTWGGLWSVNKDKNLWDVTYSRYENNRYYSLITLQEAQIAWENAVKNLIVFCHNSSDNITISWAKNFSAMLQVTENRNSHILEELSHFADTPNGKLFYLVSKHWVFHGMGNWADNLPPENEKEENIHLTIALYDAVVSAMCSSVNNY